MHIVFATVEFVTEKNKDGGLANYLAKTSQILAERGHEITVVVISERRGNFEFCKNVDVVRVLDGKPEIAFITSFVRDIDRKTILTDCWNSYRLNKKIREINRKKRIDIVQYCHLNALGLFRSGRIPSVVRMSSFAPIDKLVYQADFDPYKIPIEINYQEKLNFFAIKRMNGVFAPSALTARAMQKIMGITCEVLETPSMSIEIERLPKVPGNLKGKKYLFFFGTLNNKKGLKVITQAVYRILKENPQYYFVLMGKDCGINVTKECIKPVVTIMKHNAGEYQDRVIYVPPLYGRETLNTIIYHAEMCILPFRFENFPNTCVEAMELGKIVISTYKSGISQLIKNGYNGFLVEQNNPTALADKVGEVIRLDENEKKRISQNAIKRVEKMNPDKFYNCMMKYYQKIIADYKSG